MSEAIDISDTLTAKSDQLNADDLIGGAITVQITNVSKVSGDQPVSVHITGGHQPWKPCKTMRRLLVAAWGSNASAWIGRWLVLYRDPSIRFGPDAVGGIRVRQMSHIDRPLSVSLAVSKGKKAAHKIEPFQPPQERKAQERPTADLEQVLADAELTVNDLDDWRESNGKGPVADLDDTQRAKLAGWLAQDPTRLEAIRAFAHSTTAPDTDNTAPEGEE